MLDYQKQDSPQTLSEGIAEYFASNNQQIRTRSLSPQANDFFRCHDAAHVVFGCDISLNDEAIVKISSVFGTTVGWSVLKSYRLPESKEVYAKLRSLDVVHTAVSSLYWVPLTIWRCMRMRERWQWDNFDEYLDVPLGCVREKFGIQVPH